MKAAGWMAAGSLLAALIAGATVGFGVEILLGMCAPLAAASVSWVLMERTYQRDPAKLTPLVSGAFAAKMIFFGVYVAVMIRFVGLRPVPFVASFVGYFVALYAVEAALMRRLFASQ